MARKPKGTPKGRPRKVKVPKCPINTELLKDITAEQIEQLEKYLQFIKRSQLESELAKKIAEKENAELAINALTAKINELLTSSLILL